MKIEKLYQCTKFNGTSYISQRAAEAIYTPEGKEQIKATIDYYMQNAKLLSTATSGKNESARTFMGKLRDFFERGADEDIAAHTSPLLIPGMYEHSSTPTLDWEWSMTQYERALSSAVNQKDESAMKAWDELEKSVVAHVADDVKVSIRNQQVEMIIIKKFA